MNALEIRNAWAMYRASLKHYFAGMPGLYEHANRVDAHRFKAARALYKLHDANKSDGTLIYAVDLSTNILKFLRESPYSSTEVYAALQQARSINELLLGGK